MPYRQARERGVTLIELLVTLSIAVILMTIAVPSFQDFFRRNRIQSAASDLVAALNFARSEAIRRGANVTLCKSDNGSACNTSACSAVPPATNNNCWDRGWIVVAAGQILRVQQALPNLVTVRANTPFSHQIVFRPDGRITESLGGSLFICHGGSATDARRVVLNGAGRVRVEEATSCTSP